MDLEKIVYQKTKTKRLYGFYKKNSFNLFTKLNYYFKKL